MLFNDGHRIELEHCVTGKVNQMHNYYDAKHKLQLAERKVVFEQSSPVITIKRCWHVKPGRPKHCVFKQKSGLDFLFFPFLEPSAKECFSVHPVLFPFSSGELGPVLDNAVDTLSPD